MHWEPLRSSPTFALRRHSRFVIADLIGAHRVLSTSARNGGQVEGVGHVINHQSCEGAGHASRFEVITKDGQEAYHDVVCAEVGVDPERAVVMGTAANVNYTAIHTASDLDVEVTAVVTAGVQTNAVCGGDPAAWRETPDGTVTVPPVAGTINTALLVNVPVSAAALARMAVTMTEGKTAALQRLAVPSCYSPDLATGTGTDQYCIAAPIEGRTPLTSASPHMKFGEIIGVAVREATLEALRWQNGLEASLTRGIFHALGRYGVKEATLLDDIAPLLDAADLELLRRNSKSAFFEPAVAAAAFALAAVADRARHGTLPSGVVADAMVSQAATLASGLAARPGEWPRYRSHLHAGDVSSVKVLALRALALGWSDKWRPR
jgi:adenosylcobinamide amidohydrolase